MKNIIGLLFVSSMLLLTGCATVAEGPKYSTSKAQQDIKGYAILYVFREYAEPTAWGATIKIDGKEVSTLNQGGFTWVYVKPGKRSITAAWAVLSGQKDSSIDLEIEADKKYYVDLTGISRVSGVSGGTIYFQMGSGLNNVRPNVADIRLSKCCKLQKPKDLKY